MNSSTTRQVDWREFVVTHGFRASAYYLASLLRVSEGDVRRIRSTQACRPLPKAKRFEELFALWHGRAPEESDWPAPRKRQKTGDYEWQTPELVLLASVVGQLGPKEIAKMLTARLRKITGDLEAQRTPIAVQVRTNHIGLQTNDVVGGIAVQDAGREIKSITLVYQAIERGDLRARRVGRRLVVDRTSWEEWKARRVFPPSDYVRLSTLKDSLAIRSDKLSEFARMGYIPTAKRCNPYGVKSPSTQFGTWYIDQKVARKLVADRRAGLPMPWHGRPLLDNLRVTYRHWQERRHPASCKTCAEIWGKEGPPKSLDDYIKRYPSLAHGAKRHLTRAWDPGMTVAEAAVHAKCTVGRVRRAIKIGLLETTKEGRKVYLSRTDVTLWKARKCPTGESDKSWLSLESAAKQYLFTVRELRGFIADGILNSRVGTHGAARGVVYVLKQQCRTLREKRGFTEEEAARRVGVSVGRLRVLLEGVDWRRREDGIPLITVQAVIKRLESRAGYTLEEAANEVGRSVEWVKARKRDGTIKVSRAKWDRRRLYISAPMLARLERVSRRGHKKQPSLSEDWLQVGDASLEAGVSTTTLQKWGNDGDLARRSVAGRWQYHREAVRAMARRYWANVRFHRAVPPGWLLDERESAREHATS